MASKKPPNKPPRQPPPADEPEHPHDHVEPIQLQDEMERSFLDYAAMTAITLSAGLWATLRLGRHFRLREHQIERRVAGVDGDD